MRTIYSNNTGFGSRWYRATGDKQKVNIQRKNAGSSTWKTIETVDRATFNDLARHFDIYNGYNQNPAHMLQIISAIHGEEDNSYDNN